MTELWKDIQGLEGYYQISNFGRVRSLRFRNNQVDKQRDVPKILKPSNNGHYEFFVFRSRGNQRKRMYVHRMVAEYFIPNPNNYPVVDHIDNNRLNNRADNLQWCTQKHNVLLSIGNDGNMHNIQTRHYKNTTSYYVVLFGKQVGAYKTAEEAIKARDKALPGVY